MRAMILITALAAMVAGCVDDSKVGSFAGFWRTAGGRPIVTEAYVAEDGAYEMRMRDLDSNVRSGLVGNGKGQVAITGADIRFVSRVERLGIVDGDSLKIQESAGPDSGGEFELMPGDTTLESVGCGEGGCLKTTLRRVGPAKAFTIPDIFSRPLVGPWP